MSYERLALALLHGRQYYGPALRSLQGVTDRHRCMEPVVRAAIERGGERPLQILEIGSWAGASAVSWAVALKVLSPGGRLTCVDTWRPYFDPEVDTEEIYAEMNAAARRGDVLPLFLHNIRSAGVGDIVEYTVGASSDVLPHMKPASFDIIYIDGSHAFDDVLGDLSQAARLIRDEGIVCGDDLELQRDAIDPAEHAAALRTGRDFVWVDSAGSYYHPSVTEAVAQLLGRVFSWHGFWVSRRRGSRWEWLEVSPGALPSHIADAVSASDRVRGDESSSPQVIEETAEFNIVKMGTRYVAIAKRLGPIPIGAEKLGERELPPFLLVGESLEGLRSKLADTNVVVHEGLIVDAGTYQHPLLVHEGYRGFNIVKYQSRWYAISQQAGPIDLQTADTTQLCTTGRVMEADSQEAVQQLVDGQTVEAAEHTPARHALDRAMDDLRSQLQDSAAAARTLIKDLEAVKSQLQDNAAGTRTLLEELQVLRGERDQLRATCRDLGTIRDSIEPQRVRQGRARRPRTGPDGGSGKERG